MRLQRRRRRGGDTRRFPPEAGAPLNAGLLTVQRAVLQDLPLRAPRVLELRAPGEKSAARDNRGRVRTRRQREEQHLLDGAAPDVSAGRAGGTLEADGVLLLESFDQQCRWVLDQDTYVVVVQVDDEHFPFVIDFVDVRPAEVVRLPTTLEREYPAVVDPQIQLAPPVVLHRMGVHAVGVQLAGQFQEGVLALRGALAFQLLLVDFHGFLFDRRSLLQQYLVVGDVVPRVDFWVVIAQIALYDERRQHCRLVRTTIQAAVQEISF